MKQEPWFSLLGLANRAGKIVSGEETVLAGIRDRKAYLVILACDASDRASKTWKNKCRHYDVPLYTVCDRHTLGHAIGKGHRVVVAMTDKGFSKKFTTLLDQSRG